MDLSLAIGNNLSGISDSQADMVLAWIAQMAMVIQIVTIVVGIIICCFGLKLVRVLSVIAGLAIGTGIGTGAAFGFGFSGTMIPVTILVCAVVMAVLCGGIRKLGVFFVVFMHSTGAVFSLLLPGTGLLPQRILIMSGISAAAGLLMAILALVRPDPVVVVITGISGGLSAGTAAAALIGIKGNIWIGYGIGAAAALIGIWIQFMMQSRKIGKSEKVYAERMKGQVSRESEVERARKILDEDEETEEEPESRKTARAGNADDDEDEDDDITIISEEL